MNSWPREKVHVDLQAMVQVLQPMQRLMLKTAANCDRGWASSRRYPILRPRCQLYTSGISSYPLKDLPDEVLHELLPTGLADAIGPLKERVLEHAQNALGVPPHEGELLHKAAGHLPQGVVALGDGDGYAYQLQGILGLGGLQRSHCKTLLDPWLKPGASMPQ